MKFNEQAVFKYDASEFADSTMAEILSREAPGDVSSYRLSAVSDFREVFAILREYYDNYPFIDIKELRTNVGENQTAVDDLWHEPVALKLEFSRVLKMRAKIDLGEETAKHGKTGVEKTYDIRLHTGVPVLFDLDYWPRIGDEFVWRGVLHTVRHVKIHPKCYFQNTGLPLHITMDAFIKQHDGTILHSQDTESLKATEERGRPLLPGQQPESFVDHEALRRDDGF